MGQRKTVLPCLKDVSDILEMRRCPDCSAPNPPTRAVCYACGQRLNKPAAPVRAEPAYDCLNCQSPIPYSAKSCPACGRVAQGTHAAVQNAVLAPMPPGWDIEPLPDGTVRLRRAWAGNLFDVNSFIVFMGVSLFAVWGLERLIVRFFPLPMPLAWGTLLLSAVLIGIACLTRREEIRTGKGFIEWQQNTLGIKRKKRLHDGVFRIEQWTDYEHRGERVIYTELVAVGSGGRIRLQRQAQREQTLFRHVTQSRDLSLLLDDLQILGNYLAAQTGWPFVPQTH